MGLLCDYFIATSDDMAADAIDWPGGPTGTPPPGKQTAPGFSANDIEPFVALGMLEELLGGRTFEEQLEASSDPVATARRGELLVVPIHQSFVELVADADDAVLEAVAEPWSNIEELSGFVTPHRAAAFIGRFRTLCVQARGRHRVYCWVSV